MAKRILLINPIGVDIFDQLTVDLVSPDLREDTTVECRSLTGTPRTPFLVAPHLYHDTLIGMVAGAADEGFDAVGISCCGDPALAACKSVSRVPVTAPFEAMSAVSRSLGPFAVLQRKLPPAFAAAMPTQRDSHWIVAMLRGYGVSDGDVTYRKVEVADHPDPEETARLAAEDPDLLRERILAAMRTAAVTPGLEEVRAAAEAGATSAFFACTFWGGLLDEVRARAPIPVLDPLTVVAKYTEFLATVA